MFDSKSLDSKSSFAEDSASLSENKNQWDSERSKHDIQRNFEKLAAKESIAVNGSKFIVYVVLLLASVAAGTGTYIHLSNQEEEDFHNKFKAYARELVDKAEENVVGAASVLRDLSVEYTSYADTSDESAPAISLPNFEHRTKEGLEMLKARLLALVMRVSDDNKDSFESYTKTNHDWIREGLDYYDLTDAEPGELPPQIHDVDGHQAPILTYGSSRVYFPLWQMNPAPLNASVIMMDLATIDWFQELLVTGSSTNEVVLSGFVDLDFLLPSLPKSELTSESTSYSDGEPHNVMVFRMMSSFDGGTPAGSVFAALPWATYFEGVLPEGVNGILVDINDGCGKEFTFRIDGVDARFVGEDTREAKNRYGSIVQAFNFTRFASSTYASLSAEGLAFEEEAYALCNYTLYVYPTTEFAESFETSDPAVYTCVVVILLVFTAAVFGVYDFTVGRRQRRVIASAERSTALVSSLFPSNVHKRIMEEVEEETRTDNGKKSMNLAAKSKLKEFLGDGEAKSGEDTGFKTKPIADLFPETTIMFADLVGFTAWSSTREPHQVFILLETIYHAFDGLAKRRRVFKVETVGDCYVAVAGLPEPRLDHAVVMARFARDCLLKLHELTKQLEVTLGPDTGDLNIRIGLHSGPVTAGVLRGERARFQLFGDTVNTTSRMESNGAPGRIHISQETADLLSSAGKKEWFSMRKDKIVAKGKGEMTTYWLEIHDDSNASTMFGSTHGAWIAPGSGTKPEQPSSKKETDAPVISPRQVRLVNWNADVLLRLLKEVVAGRGNKPITQLEMSKLEALEQTKRNTMVLEEVVEIIKLPKFKSKTKRVDVDSVELSEKVIEQLHNYVETISFLYRDNPFHNFEHVSHVTMSVVKLLSRIVAPDLEDDADAIERTLHDHTYGITSDPLTQFAVVLSALIHDVDHTGVPNSQLIKENAEIAALYKNKSVAEQNSVDIAWDLLMNDNYREFRHAIYTNESEFRRFRQLVVNTVMATDIIDKDLGQARKARWNKAFAEGYASDLKETEADVNRKATIVIEHLIQASDVAHTMQHWHIYRKWNTRLFEELYRAYTNGRSQKDPAEFWYEGEIGFFDFYIIPLAKKLKDCGVFGVSSDEYLTYAVQNRNEWENKGKELVEGLVRDMRKKYPTRV